MKTWRIIVATLWLLVAVPACIGFGNDGHRIVGAIAEGLLTPSAKAEIQSLLGSKSLAESATWADEVRSNPDYFFAKPLHYINVPRTVVSIDEGRDCKNGKCVVDAIRRYAGILKERSNSPAARSEALKFVIHFVGDVHQPLHVSYSDDQGGNEVKVKWFGSKDWSLHSVWDTAFIKKRMGSKTWDQLAASIRVQISEGERETWMSKTEPAEWANESLQLTRTIYEDLPDSRILGQAYYGKYISRYEKQMAAAGVRLGKLLNEVLATSQISITTNEVSTEPLTICSFNIQFLGQSTARKNAALADILKGYDIVVVQELIAPPYPGLFPDGTPFRTNGAAAAFFDAMKAKGFGFVLSEEDTGKGPKNHLNSTSTEWWVAFFRSNRVDYAPNLPHGFLSINRAANPEFDRVPYAFGFRSKNQHCDFVLISVHLRPGSGKADRARRVQELGSIGKWISTSSATEKDFIILGDMNIEDEADLTAAMPKGMSSLNEKLKQTNTNVNGPKPYDQVMYNRQFTSEMDQDFGFRIVGLVALMKDYWGATQPYPGDEPYNHDSFRKYFSDHNPVVFRLKTDGQDDD